jgi:hypothetical protein
MSDPNPIKQAATEATQPHPLHAHFVDAQVRALEAWFKAELAKLRAELSKEKTE